LSFQNKTYRQSIQLKSEKVKKFKSEKVGLENPNQLFRFFTLSLFRFK